MAPYPWPSTGSGLPPAVVSALTTPDALPILQAIAIGCLAVKDKVAVPAAVPGYDVLFDDATSGNVQVEWPAGGVNTVDLS